MFARATIPIGNLLDRYEAVLTETGYSFSTKPKYLKYASLIIQGYRTKVWNQQPEQRELTQELVHKWINVREASASEMRQRLSVSYRTTHGRPDYETVPLVMPDLNLESFIPLSCNS